MGIGTDAAGVVDVFGAVDVAIWAGVVVVALFVACCCFPGEGSNILGGGSRPGEMNNDGDAPAFGAIVNASAGNLCLPLFLPALAAARGVSN